MAGCSSPCRGRSPTGMTLSPRPLPPGAAGALVSRPVDGPHILVGDVPKALTDLAIAARNRCTGTIIGVTGSVGKTSTKEALYAALERYAKGKVHRSVKSYNNHTGVPLSLARMPRDSEFAVLEMGMSAKGEIAALTRLVRPHVAMVTTIASAHIEHLGSMEAIADAKAEIFEGLEPEGDRHRPRGHALPRPAGEGGAQICGADDHLRPWRGRRHWRCMRSGRTMAAAWSRRGCSTAS